MQEDEGNREIARHALKGVPPRAIPAVPVNIDFSGAGKDHTKDRVESDGAKEHRPFDDLKRWKGMDEVHFMLESLDAGIAVLRLPKQPSPDNGGVGGQVRKQKQAHREHARETVQAAEQVVMAINDGHGRSLLGLQ